jgi:hypothetical protein
LTILINNATFVNIINSNIKYINQELLQFIESINLPEKEEVLSALERGEITAEQAIERLSK